MMLGSCLKDCNLIRLNCKFCNCIVRFDSFQRIYAGTIWFNLNMHLNVSINWLTFPNDMLTLLSMKNQQKIDVFLKMNKTFVFLREGFLQENSITLDNVQTLKSYICLNFRFCRKSRKSSVNPPPSSLCPPPLPESEWKTLVMIVE